MSVLRERGQGDGVAVGGSGTAAVGAPAASPVGVSVTVGVGQGVHVGSGVGVRGGGVRNRIGPTRLSTMLSATIAETTVSVT